VGRTWGYARDAAGRLSQLRRPDGTAVSVKLDEAGRPEAVGPARVRRDGAARAVELSAPGWGGVRWTRDAAGRVTAVEAGAVHFEAAYDAGGHLVTASLGESPLSVQWDSAGNVSGAGPLPAEAGVQTRIERNGAGRITALIRGDLALRLARDLRGRVDAVTEGDRKWEVGRDPLGRIARLEGPDGLSVGANWEPDGGLSMIRLDGGTIVRRNVSADAGEILAVNGAGDPIGHAGWTLDDSGLVETVVLGRKLHIQRDASGVPTAVEVDGPPVPGSEVWSRTPSEVGGWDGLHADLDPDGGLKRLRVAADADRAWGLEAGEATARRDGAGRLTGLDGSAGGATLVHDDLGRLVSYAVGERSVRLARDAFGRLVDVGATSTAGWDGLLRWGAQIRAPIAAEAVARPGGAVLCDPRGFPFFVPWVGGLRTWPTGFVPGIEAAETGPRGRVALDAGGPLISLTDAVDPLTGQRTSGPPLLPWTARRVEPPEALSPWASPDAASPAEWDAAGWDRSGWTDALARLLDRGMLAHAGPEAPSTPGLPWLPASFGAEVPAPVAGVGGLILDEDPATAVVLGWALSGSPPDAAAMVRALAGDRLASEARVAPGLDPPLPPTLRAPLASEPFGH
jgi:hypothetical protein